MKKLICMGSVLLGIMAFVSGCSNEIPELNENDQEAVVEYAADIVKKYDKRHAGRLKEIMREEPAAAEETAAEPEQAAPSPEASALQPDPDVEIIDPFEGNGVPAEVSLENFLQMDSVAFTYTGYETLQSYPPAGDGAYFSMNATPGTTLLVLKFTVNNQAGEDRELDMLGTGVRFRITVNGETKNALSTMLLNDLATYKGPLEAGGSTELVVVCEIQEEQAASVGEVSLIAKNEDATATISLN